MEISAIAAAVVGFLFGAASAGFTFSLMFTSRMVRVETRMEVQEKMLHKMSEDVHQISTRFRTRSADRHADTRGYEL